jgi:hypothetical protein
MSVLTKAIGALRELEEELAATEPMRGGADSVRLAEKIRAVRALLSEGHAQWVGTTEAKRLLGVGSENTVKAWARSGRLRSRSLPNGRLQVLLDDVLRRRELTEGLTAIDRGEDISPEELDQLMGQAAPLYPNGEGQPDGAPTAPAAAREVVPSR